MKKIKLPIYIQAEKYSFEKEFSIKVNTYKVKTDTASIVIDIEERELTIEVPEFTQEQFTNGHIEQLRALKEKVKAEAYLKITSLDEQIESLLAIEHKELEG